LTRCRCVGNRHTCGIQNVNPNVVVVGQGGPKGAQGATGIQGAPGSSVQGTQGAIGPIGPGGGAQGTQGTQGAGVSVQQVQDAISGAALGSTDDLSEGISNLYFKTSRVAYTHLQGSPSDTWVINHNLNFYPNVTVQDSAGTIYEGEIAYTNLVSLTVTFSSSFSGKAYLS
jgi:hypothetical protein